MSAASKKALLKVGYTCNNNCVFCHSSPHRGYDSSIAEIRRKITAARELGAAMVVLSGGEPTIRKDLGQITAAIRESGMKIGLVSNGRMLAYERLADRLILEELEYVYLSLCGPDPAVHNRHTRSESFAQTLRGIGNVAKRVGQVTVNVPVTSCNLPLLEQVFELAASLGSPLRLKFSMLEPEGAVLAHFEKYVPSLLDAARAAMNACRRMEASAAGSVAPLWDGFPLCLVPEDLRRLESGLREDGFFLMSEAFEEGWHPVDDANRGFAERCLDCSLRRRCRGVYRQYLLRRGADELRPCSLLVPNSFNLLPAAAEIDFQPERCSILSGGMAPPDPVREILVCTRPGRFQLCLAATRDFADASVAASIRESGQVYRSRAIDRLEPDIRSDLEKLTLAVPCRCCPRRPLCGGAWLALGAEIGFERFNQRLLDLLSTLRGSIVDIGCGRAPYLAALAKGLGSGTTSYVGLDPHQGPEPLPRGVQFRLTTLDRFEWPGQPFENTLALRSLAHLGSLSETFGRIAALTAPAGRVFLAEDDVFAVVRTREMIESIAGGGDLPFEHLSNPRLDEAVELSRQAGLMPVHSFSSAENDCPTWLLECRRE